MLSLRKKIWGILGACFLAFLVVLPAKATVHYYDLNSTPNEGNLPSWIYQGQTFETASGEDKMNGITLYIYDCNIADFTLAVCEGNVDSYSDYQNCRANQLIFGSFDCLTGQHDYLFSFTIDITPETKYTWFMQQDSDANDVILYSNNDYSDGQAWTVKSDNTYLDSWGGAKDYLFKIIYDDEISEVPEGEKVWFDFPQTGFEISNSEWNDWSLWYDLEADDIGDVANLILVVSQDANNISNADYDFISTSTELTAWVLERTKDYPDGPVYSKAKIVKIDSADGCTTGYEETCIWTTVAESEVINWTASTTGWTVFDNPYDKPAGFYPATSTVSSEDQGIIEAILNRLSGIFPLSISFQLYGIFKEVKNDPTVQPAVLDLKDVMPDEADAILGSSTYPILSYQILSENMPAWDETILPAMNTLVYMVGFFFLIFILWPRSKNIKPAGNE